MIKKVIKYIVSYSNFLNLRFHGVVYDSNVKIRGLLSISNQGEIIIGSGVKINSRYSANPVGQGTCTGLYTFPNGEIVIGDNVGMSNVLLYSRDSIIVEDRVFLGGGVQILDNDFHSLHYENRILRPDPDVRSASVTICEGAFIGANSIILKGVTIGAKSVIGAGSVVTKSVPSGQIWAGNPARFIKSIDDFKMNDKQYKPLDEEISLSDVLSVLRRVGHSVRRYKYIYLLLVTTGLVAGFLYNKSKPTTFTAKGTYLVIEGGGQSGGGLGSVLATFGIGTSDGASTNLTKVIEISKSQQLIFPILLDTVSIRGERDLLAHFILANLQEQELLGEGTYRISTDSTDASLREKNRLLRIAHNYLTLIPNPVISLNHAPDATGTFLNLNISSIDEELAFIAYHKIYDGLESFYTEKTISRMARNYESTVEAVDSLQQRMGEIDASLASYEDRSTNLVLSRDRVRRNFWEREKQITTILYGEAVKKMTIVSQVRNQEEPVFQLLAEPLYPLPSSRPSLVVYITIGAIGGLFIAMVLHCLIVILRC